MSPVSVGLALIDEGVRASPNPRGWYFIAYALDGMRNGEYDEAMRWALRLDSPDWFMVPMIVASTAGLTGQFDIATRASQQLLELHPSFPQSARQELQKWLFQEELLERFLSGLRAAGLDIS